MQHSLNDHSKIHMQHSLIDHSNIHTRKQSLNDHSLNNICRDPAQCYLKKILLPTKM